MTTPRSFPRLPLITVFTVLVIVVGAALFGRSSHAGDLPVAAQVAGRDLIFLDRDDGAVVALAADDRHTVDVFVGQQGFLRGVLRGFARTRHLSGFGPEQPFHLARWSDGRLTIDDPATKQHVELLAFGPDQRGRLRADAGAVAMSLFSEGTVSIMADIDIEKTFDSFHAYSVPVGIDIRPGDVVYLHGVPTDIGFGERLITQVSATVHRAGPAKRAWTAFTSMFQLTDLYEVGFEPKEA